MVLGGGNLFQFSSSLLTFLILAVVNHLLVITGVAARLNETVGSMGNISARSLNTSNIR